MEYIIPSVQSMCHTGWRS